MDFIIKETTPQNAKKRTKEPEKWKTSVRKKLKYSAKGMPKPPSCNHRGKMMCRLLKMRDFQKFHEAFYEVPTKKHQDTFLCKYVKKLVPNKEGTVRKLSLKFFIENQVGNPLRVCRQTFLDVLGLTKHRVLGIFKNFKKNANSLVPIETRGGWRKEKTYLPKQESVINFIKQLKAVESHYSRNKSTRLYLPSELSVAELCRNYNKSVVPHLLVKEHYFRTIFNKKFNLSFSTPATDECSTCLEFSNKIKLEHNEKKKEDLKLAKLLHNKKAKCFFAYLKEKPDDCLLLSFDCQKNLVLPKVSDQAAYYSRQLYCYNLTVVTGKSTGNLNPDNVSIYTWTENQGQKSSNEVASVVYNELKSKNLTGYKTVRLVADGCAGQNKNINMLTMCASWLGNDAPKEISSLEMVFPVTGHSYMPSDRVFGFIEQKLNKIKTIINVSDYHEVFKKFGTVKEIDKDWLPYDWREEAKRVNKTAAQLHFQVMQSKRFTLKRSKKSNHILIKGEPSYNLDTGVFKFIEKKGKTISSVNPSTISIGKTVNHLKIKDVDNLLQKHFGQEWKNLESLKWYKEVLERNGNINKGPDGENEAPCECLDPDFTGDEELYCASKNVL